jgi:regulator of sirC expression with transglutaminase-like and TPR domain
MRSDNAARRRFTAQIRLPDDRLNLAEAALCVAWEDRGHGDPDAALRQLDAMAGAVRPRLDPALHPPTVIAALNSYLFDDLGLHGNTWAYSDPANSYLDDVLTSRVGIPIALSVVYLEVGWRLGLPLSGVALPGHFIVRYEAPGQPLFVDPFNAGRLWSDKECLAQVQLFYGSVTDEMMRQIMEPPSRRDILIRLLRNLKNSYLERDDDRRALATIERIMLLDDDPAERRDRGLLNARLGRLDIAIDDLDHYARLEPRASDLDLVRRQARALAERIGRRN